MAEQSDPFFAPADLLITTLTLSIENLAQVNLLQKHKERVGQLPQPDRLMTKHIEEFLQFEAPVTFDFTTR